MKSVARQAFRYALVGLGSTAINYVLFTGGIAIGLHYLISATIGSIFTVLFGYFLNRTFTFSASGKANRAEFASFIGIFIIQYSLAVIGYYFLIGCFHLDTSIAFVLNNIAIVFLTFTLLRNYTFKKEYQR